MTSTNIKEFSADMTKLAELVHKDVVTIKRYIVLALFNTITLPPHPVLTGYLRSNWRIANGAPDTSVNAPPGKVDIFGNARTAPRPPPIAENSALDAITIEVPTYVTNSVNYVGFVEDGTSKMAPRHFIKRAIQVVEARAEAYIQSRSKTP